MKQSKLEILVLRLKRSGGDDAAIINLTDDFSRKITGGVGLPDEGKNNVCNNASCSGTVNPKNSSCTNGTCLTTLMENNSCTNNSCTNYY
jgi:hypothetical protein